MAALATLRVCSLPLIRDLAANAAVLETVALVARLHDVAMVSQTVQQGSRHLGIRKHTGPFRAAPVGW